MHCPHCLNNMSPIAFDTIAVDHCDVCGYTFFDQNEINRITFATALTLAKQKSREVENVAEMTCPRDGTTLTSTHMESIPQHVVILSCAICGGTLTSAQDLVEFKKAQDAKLHYFTSWRMPMPSLRSVLVFSFVMAISLTVVNRYGPFFGPSTVSTRAADELCPIEILNNDSTIVVLCKSSYPYTSNAFFISSTTGINIKKVVSATPTNVHILTINTSDILDLANTCVQIALSNEQTTRTTPCVPLVQ